MGAQVLVSLGQIIPRIGGEIAEGCRQAVGSMLTRDTTERPKGVLQALGQGNKALATEHDVGMFKSGIGQPKVVKAVIELRAPTKSPVIPISSGPGFRDDVALRSNFKSPGGRAPSSMWVL